MFYIFFLLINFNAFDLMFCFNKYLDTYDELNYEPIQFRRSRESNGRSTTDVKFRSRIYNRDFHLILNPLNSNNDVFSDNHIIDVDGVYSNVIKPNEFIYEGHLSGEPNSIVYGTLFGGIFDGYIETGDGKTYTIEKVDRYFEVGERPIHCHSILYSDDDINHTGL